MTDRFTAIPALIAGTLLALLFAFNYAASNFERYGGLELLCLVLLVAVFITLLVKAIGHAFQRRWRRFSSLAAGLLLVVGCFVVRSEIRFVIDHIRLRMFKSDYVAIATVVGPDERGLTVLHWGFWSYFLSGIHYRKLVYDKNGVVVASDGARSAELRKAIQSSIEPALSYCTMFARRMNDQFYLVDVYC